jgi:hypothetical protein
VLKDGATLATLADVRSFILRDPVQRPECAEQDRGTALYATSVGDEQKAYNVRLGSLRQRNELVPRRQIFVRSQQAWVNDLNSITKFDGPPH